MSDLVEQLKAVLAGQYTIERELGGGGMSRVFLATETALRRQVVVKVLPPEMGAGVNVERFRREIELAASLQHPHVVPLLTAGSQGDLLYYVMPFIAGESLRTKLAREGELPVGEVARILRDVADALAHAHTRGVVHRDIKPDNILLTGKHAVVTDFGVAKAVSDSTGGQSLTSIGVALGTPAYMAPEQAAAEPNIDHRADLYALGALAYEMLCGRPPFTGPNAQQVLAAHVTQAPEPVTARRPTVPPAFAALVMRCLEKHPADRPQHAEEVLGHLEAMVTPSGGMAPTGATPISSGTEAAIRRAHPVRVAALFGLASIGVLTMVYWLVHLLGLPDWVVVGAAGLLVVGLAAMLVTSRLERARLRARTTGAARPDLHGGLAGLFTWRKAILGGGVAFAGLGLVTAVYTAMRLLGIGPAGTLLAKGALAERERIILAEFENRTSDSTLGETVTELLRIDLAQSPAVTVLEPVQIAPTLRRMQREPSAPLTFDAAKEVAEREGIKAIVTGDIVPIGRGYVVSARLVGAGSGEALAAGRESASDADGIIAAVDRLSATLRERIGESLRSIRADDPLEDVTTHSLVALRKYAEGNEANSEGDYPRALRLLEEAIALDTGFAMAYRKLGVILSNTGERRERIVDAITKAYQRRDRLTERERYTTEGSYYSIVRQDEEATSAAYRNLLEKYSTDPIALNNLALNYMGMRRWAEAESLYQRATSLTGPPAPSFSSLAAAQVFQGKLDVADTTLHRFAAAYPRNPGVVTMRVGLAVARGDFAAAESLFRARAAERGLSPVVRVGTVGGLGALLAAQGRMREAERYGQEALTIQYERGLIPVPRPVVEAIGHADSVVWYGGDVGAALRRLEEVSRLYRVDTLPPSDRGLVQRAELYARAGRPEAARRWLGRYETEVEEERRRLREQNIRHAQAQIALAEGRIPEAIAGLRDWEAKLACTICGLFDLGHAYDRAGQIDSAIAVFERYATTPAFGYNPRHLPAILKRLGELFEQRGDRAKAVEYYGRFADLWKSADPELQPQVRDVRARMTRLTGEQSR